MAITKISFTAEQNLLNKMQNLKTTVPQPQASTPLPADDKTVPEKNNNVRNWSIGLGSAAVLISLGVMGRKGLLGEGIQKVLGGVKKNAADEADELVRRLSEELDETVERKAGQAVDDIVEPEVFGPETVTVKPQAPEQPKTDIFGNEINKAADEVLDIEKINAGLNRTIPQIEENLMKCDVPDVKPLMDELNSIDISKIEGDYAKITLPDGNTREIILNGNGKISTVFDTNKEGEKILSASFVNGKVEIIQQGNNKYRIALNKLSAFTKSINGTEYRYTGAGNLSRVTERNVNGTRSRVIDFHAENGTLEGITYYNDADKMIKFESFKDGKLRLEEFYDENEYFVKEILHDV